MTPQQIKNKLTQGDRVRFKDGFITYFEKPYVGDDTKGWFKEKPTSTSAIKYYKNIVKIGSKDINEIIINKPGARLKATYKANTIDVEEIPVYGRFNNNRTKIAFPLNNTNEIKSVGLFLKQNNIPFDYNEFNIDGGSFIIDTKYFNFDKPITENKMSIQELYKKELKKIIQEQKEETLTFEKDPTTYILTKYPSLEATLTDLMSPVFKDFITGVFVISPKPTTFKILLHNGQSFLLIYNPKAYTAKISGKLYNLMSLKEEEYAIKGISNLLLLGIPPMSEGPETEINNEFDPKDNLASDLTSEPDLGLDDIDASPEIEPGNEGGDEEPEEELQEQEEPKKKIRFRLIK